jgi:hypothetical protein
MIDKVAIFESKEVGTFSVGNAPNSRYDMRVGICVARDGIEMSASFFFKLYKNPKIRAALIALKKAMIEESADDVEIIVTD